MRDTEIYYHGTKATLAPGDLIAAGYTSNFGKRRIAYTSTSPPCWKPPPGARNWPSAKAAGTSTSSNRPGRSRKTPVSQDGLSHRPYA